jgi:pilus assembly protein Flp/PilA
MGSIRRFILESDGTTAVEYAVMLAMILMAVIAAIGTLGSQSGGMWGGVNGNLTSHGFGS